VGATGVAETITRDPDDPNDSIDFYGHWWIETGSLADPANPSSWVPARSYGWWPASQVSVAQTLKIDRVDGVLNKGQARDPHHGDKADVEYHPVLEVDDKDDYETVRDRVVGDLDAFASGFNGSWNWRLGWGKNCHTFVERAKKRLHLHHQNAKGWLTGEGVVVGGAADYLHNLGELVAGQGFQGMQSLGGHLAGQDPAMLLAASPKLRQEFFDKLNENIDPTNMFSYAKPEEVNQEFVRVFGAQFQNWLPVVHQP